jgi:hypothetical protein
MFLLFLVQFNRLYIVLFILQNWSIFVLENYELSSIYGVSIGKIRLCNHILFWKKMFVYYFY